MAQALQVELIDFSSIRLAGNDLNPEIVTISRDDGFFLNTRFTSDFRIRKSIYDMMRKAQSALPENHYFMIYEAYRPLARQVELWNRVTALLKEKYPEAAAQEIRNLTETFVADPYNGIGSGHQACCAIDVSLCDHDGREYDMGTQCQEVNELSRTFCDGLPATARRHREILVGALEGAGLINYPPEWWHFSYGDHQWAHLAGKAEAFFGPLDI